MWVSSFASHAHTNKPIVLISHPSKLLVNVLRKILDVFLIPELPVEQAGFRRGGGTRDHIANIRWMIERAREHQQSLCFIDFKKVFDCVDRSRGMWIILEMGAPTHQVVLLRNMYANQKAAIKTDRWNSLTSGKMCDRVASCLLCYSTSTQRKQREKLWTNGKEESADTRMRSCHEYENKQGNGPIGPCI